LPVLSEKEKVLQGLIEKNDKSKKEKNEANEMLREFIRNIYEAQVFGNATNELVNERRNAKRIF